MRLYIIFVVWCLLFSGALNDCAAQQKILTQTTDSLQIEALKRKIRQHEIEADSLKYIIKSLHSPYKNPADSNAGRQETLYFLTTKNNVFSIKDLLAIMISVLAVSLPRAPPGLWAPRPFPCPRPDAPNHRRP